MASLVDQVQQLIQGLVGGDLLEITLLSLAVSGVATALSLLIGLPLGTWLALSRFRSRGLMLSVVNTGMALPPVVVGLFVAFTLWRSGPLGEHHRGRRVDKPHVAEGTAAPESERHEEADHDGRQGHARVDHAEHEPAAAEPRQG